MRLTLAAPTARASVQALKGPCFTSLTDGSFENVLHVVLFNSAMPKCKMSFIQREDTDRAKRLRLLAGEIRSCALHGRGRPQPRKAA